MKTENLPIATFGAGCFWCIEALFQRLNGVHKVVSGFSGGDKENPTYRDVCGGDTGHAEVAQIYFDPAVVPYEQLVEIFFTFLDPTTLNRQGSDMGTQYRSVIFYQDEEQKATAERLKSEFAPTLWEDPIVTEISPLGAFYRAEDYHQNYFKTNPYQGYCMVIIKPKMKIFKKKYAHLLKK